MRLRGTIPWYIYGRQWEVADTYNVVAQRALSDNCGMCTVRAVSLLASRVTTIGELHS